MKRFLINLLLFSGYSLVVYIGLIIVFGVFVPGFYKKNLKYLLGSNGHLFTRIKEVDKTKNIDVLVIGSSHAYRGYDPRIFASKGITMFNLGSSSQSYIQTEALLKQYLSQLNPKFIIFDIYPVFLGSDGVESGLDLISNDHIDSKLVDMTFRVNNIELYNTLIYSCFRQIMGLNKSFVEPLKKGEDTYIPGGFVESYKIVHQGKLWNPYDYTFNDKQVEALQRIVQLFINRKIPFSFLQAPLPPKRYAKIKNNNVVDSLLSTMGPYYNFNKVLSLPDSLFSDDSHLNQWGVNIYNQQLIEKLKLAKVNNKLNSSINISN